MGGIELYIQHLAIGLQEKGHQVKVIVPAFTEDEKKNYCYKGVEVIRYIAKHPVNRFQFAGIEANESLKNFDTLIQNEKPDIIHFSQLTNSSGISLQHIEIAKRSGAKIIYTNHLSEFICQRGDLVHMGSTTCDGIVDIQKCTKCILDKRGIKKAMANTAALIDSILIKGFGEKNYKRQLKPFVFPGFFTRWHIQKVKSVINTVDAFVSIANWSNDLLQKNGWKRANCTTITTGLLSTSIMKPAALADYNGQRPLKVVFMGRIFPVKGVDILIKAAKKIPAHLIEINIYGPKDNGGYSEYFNECTSMAKLCENIFFHEPVENDAVVKIMAGHDVLCIPSRGNEMAPLVIQEAMAAGIPVLGADLPAIKEWVTDMHNGFIFSTNDPVALRTKLMLIINNPSSLQSVKKQVQKPGSFSNVVEQYESLYNSVLEKA